MVIDYDNIPNPKVKIYAETANYILDKCFSRADDYKKKSKNTAQFARIKGDEYVLAAVLDSLIVKQPITGRFLKNKSNEVAQLIKSGSYQTIGFDHIYLLTLAVFAGIDDYEKLDLSFGPKTALPVLFTCKPFPFYKLIRVPLHGHLSQNGEKWELVADDGTTFSGTQIKTSFYTMSGDRLALWLEITYQSEEQSLTLYLAEADSSSIIPVKESKIEAFFDAFRPVN